MQVLTDDVQSEYGPGVTVWGKGDTAHQSSSSDHNEDDTPGSKPEQTDADSTPEHRAIDIPFQGPFSLTDADDLRRKLTERPENQRRLKYVILGQTIWRKNGGWRPEDYSGEFHNHLHVSGDAADDENGAHWDIRSAPPVQTQDETTDLGDGETMLITYIYASAEGGKPTRWGKGVLSGGCLFWFETTDQGRANGYAAPEKISAVKVTQQAFDDERANFIESPA